ncbi:gamma-glutamylcyclotransferase family protein [Pelobacter seleniigenes]|uniref:gamma-glutamylcyclotransferase family protein n=1 Tax=Pelobacter seleniigenes TaxID=407188 RepID=UPI000691254C|nr:gamma-glutamylcyclotransferase family protein [Pelobacter seleniigenes]
MNLFVYGTLLDEDIMQLVAGTVPPSIAVRLHGYRRRKICGQVYPGIVIRAGETVAGRLYLNVSAELLARLDRFEGGEYERTTVLVESTSGEQLLAETYVLAPGGQSALSNESWSLAEFLGRGKQLLLQELKK